jgi:NADH:ubiquinone oxidoreductase subunit 6 (subunit J)
VTLYHYLAEGMFFLIAGMTLLGGVLAVSARQLMHSVLGLAVTFLGVAGMYIYLGSLFLSLMQILIYLGAIGIVLVFGVMIGYTPRQEVEDKMRGENLLLAVPACGAGFVLLWIAIGQMTWEPAAERAADFSIRQVGFGLLHSFCLAFELISILLLIAIIGAILVANSQEDPDGQ